MTNQVDTALIKLNSILPLQASQSKLPINLQNLHKNILVGFVNKGRMLDTDEMCTFTEDVTSALKTLSKLDMVTLDSTGQPDGAYPFSCQKRQHKIAANSQELHAMCAMDALAISCMFNIRTVITSKCCVSGETIVIQQDKFETQSNLDSIYFGINWGSSNTAVSCSESLCMDMVFLNNKTTAEQWQASSITSKEIFTLEQAIIFADKFFSPLLK